MNLKIETIILFISLNAVMYSVFMPYEIFFNVLISAVISFCYFSLMNSKKIKG